MSKFVFAAGPVATLISLIALTGIAIPGKALGLDRLPEAAAVVSVVPAINTPSPVSVPAPAISAAPAEIRSAEIPQAVEEGYASLAEAVADQPTPGAGDAASAELSCLAGAVYFESKGEPLAGQLAVANVIIARTVSGRFPGSICGVVKQPGQFSFLHGGQMPAIPAGAQYRTAMAVAKVAMDKDWENPAPRALFFHARRVAPRWGKAPVATIGNHIFYR